MLSVTINNYQIVGIIEKYKLIGHIFFCNIKKHTDTDIYLYIYKIIYKIIHI